MRFCTPVPIKTVSSVAGVPHIITRIHKPGERIVKWNLRQCQVGRRLRYLDSYGAVDHILREISPCAVVLLEIEIGIFYNFHNNYRFKLIN